MIEVADQTLYQQRGHLDLPDDRVATAAQQAAHSPRRVAVVHDQDARGGVTEKHQLATDLGMTVIELDGATT